jgi:hypothetical protein
MPPDKIGVTGEENVADSPDARPHSRLPQSADQPRAAGT